MQKGFILIFGALLGSYLPATAQTRPAQVYPMQEHYASIMRLMAAAPAHLPLTGSLLIQPLEEPPALVKGVRRTRQDIETSRRFFERVYQQKAKQRQKGRCCPPPPHYRLVLVF